MKNLIIVRHAKSSWAKNVEDKNRALTSGGIERAKAHAGILKNHLDFDPEYWVSSHAMRALHTAVIFADEFQHIDNLKIQKSLYTFSATELRNAIHNFPDVLESAIIFGHNDACHQLIIELLGEHLPEFKTASVACIEFKQNRWENISDGELKFLISKEEIQ